MTAATLLAVFVSAVPVASAADAPPRIEYSKDFPGSVPPYQGVIIQRDGQALYKDSPTDENPLKFRLKDAEVDEVFALAARLDRFTRPLESNLKVARMGIKTFRWEEGDTHNQVQFNYSVDPDAQALADFFEKALETVQTYLALDRAVHFDKLGINKAVIGLQATMERKRLVGGEQFLPLLDRIIKNDAIMHIARERAAMLAEQIRGVKPVAPDAPAAPAGEPGAAKLPAKAGQ